MSIRELIKIMFHSFFVITTGATFSMYVSCSIFYPDTTLTPADIGGVLVLALICDLSFLIFYSRKELSKRQMSRRFLLHILLEIFIVLSFAHIYDWVNIDRPIEVAGFVLLILGVYAAVLAVNLYQDKKTADKLNHKLKQRYHTKQQE